MRFNILESKKRKLSNRMEGDSFDEVFENIAGIYNVKTDRLMSCCEVRQNIMRYMIFDRYTKIATLELVVD